ncbi:MAG: molybdopterin-synthase adenylyltransferase MoeB [Thermoanaerobaculia bacterium]
MPSLTSDELARYARQISLPQIGPKGQEMLARASVLLIGAGGLGSPASLYLAAAGVGRIGIADGDVVDASNLHRQVLHSTATVGESKVDSARERLTSLNPHVRIETFRSTVTSQNVRELMEAYDLVLDGSDNFPTRYLVNDAAVLLGKTNIYGSVFRFDGQASVFAPGEGPCYRCLYPDPPPPGTVPSCEEGGVLGVVPGIIGMIQATEAVKRILGIGTNLIGRLLLFDALQMRFREIRIARVATCPVCGERPTITSLVDYERVCGPGEETMLNSATITPSDLAERLRKGENIRLIDCREQWEWDMGHIEKAELIPAGKLARDVSGFSPVEEIVVYCRSGARSGQVVSIMRSAGLNAKNMLGGILRWSHDVDPSMPRY